VCRSSVVRQRAEEEVADDPVAGEHELSSATTSVAMTNPPHPPVPSVPTADDVMVPGRGPRRGGRCPWFVLQLPVWDWPPFLTDAYDEVLPALTSSFVAAIAVNLTWVLWDPEWYRHVGTIGLNVVGLWVLARVWQVFPFDLSASPWETLVRIVLAILMVALTAATVVEVVKLLVDASSRDQEHTVRPTA
jgi:hypothetical protein